MSKKVLFFLCFLIVLLPAITLAAKSYSYYKNGQYNITFKYPSTWTAHQPQDENGAIYYQADYFSVPARDSGYNISQILQTVAMPENSYPNTNFKQAYVTVAVNQIDNKDQCKQYQTADGTVKTLNVEKRFNGLLFYTTKKPIGGGAAGTMLGTKVYHTFYNSICYEVNLNTVTGSIYNYPKGTKNIPQAKIWRELETVLRTFTFTSQPSDWQTYENKDYHFSIQYPDNLAGFATEGSSNYEDRLLSLTIDTAEAIIQLKKAEGVEVSSFFNLTAHEPNYEITEDCPDEGKNVGTVTVGRIQATKCQISNLGKSQLYINFTKDEVLYYTIKSDTYFNSYSAREIIDMIIGTFTFLPNKSDNQDNSLKIKNYSNAELGYSVNYPAHFYQSSLLDVPTHDVYFKSENVGSPIEMSDQAIWVSLQIRDNPNHLTLDKWVQDNTNQISTKTFVINGQKALQISEVDENHGYYIVSTYVSSGEKMYLIQSLTHSVATFNKLQKYYTTIVNSFNLI